MVARRKWLAFTSDRDSNAGHLPGRWERLQAVSIYVIHPDGSDLRRVTRGRGVAGSPRWSTDAKRIYFYETTELGAWYAEFGNEAKGTTQIVSVDIADGSVIQHTTGDGIRVSPQQLPHEALGYLAKLKDGNVIRLVQKDGTTAQSQPQTFRDPCGPPMENRLFITSSRVLHLLRFYQRSRVKQDFDS